jgi:toxin ParE1/3/4
VNRFTLDKRARAHFEDIYNFTLERWGAAQAESYARELNGVFERIVARTITSRPIPAKLGVQGYFCAHKSHFVYWRYQASGDVSIVAILHQQMHLPDRVRRAFRDEP